MSHPRNTTAGLLPLIPQYSNTFADVVEALYPPRPYNALWDWRPKDEWVSPHYKRVDHGLFGYTYEFVPGYWRRRAW